MNTYNSVLLAINMAARSAVEASFDAHGTLVDPETAWEFLHQVHGDDPEFYSFLDRLTDSMPRGFVDAYRRIGVVAMRSLRDKESKED